MPYVALSKSAAQELISQYADSVSQREDEYSVERIITTLEGKVATLEGIALSAYAQLGCTGGTVQEAEQELRQRILVLHQETAALNGLNLQTTFLQALKNAEGFQLDYSKELDELQTYFTGKTEQDLISGEVATELYNEIVRATQATLPKKLLINTDGRVYESSSGHFTVDFTKPYTKLSSRAKSLFANYSKAKKEGLIESIDLDSTSIDGIRFDQEYIVKTFGVESLLRMAPEERKIVFQQYPNLMEYINQLFADQIVNSCSVSDQTLFRQCINEVLDQKPLAFFIGGNIESMTGILGEIQALYLFRNLINNPSASVSWIGGINNPHADLLLTNGLQQFGIQVKNTSREGAELEVSFQSFGAMRGGGVEPGAIYRYQNTDEAMTVLSQLGPSDLIEGIQTFLAMEGFNIYYNWNSQSKSAMEVEHNADFEAEREQIEQYAEYAKKIASLFAVSMMYMQQTSYSGGESNTLYLIGGTTLISAATILSNIVEQLRGTLMNFKMAVEGHSALKGAKGVKTIVDVINDKGHLGDTKFMLQSSYTFGL